MKHDLLIRNGVVVDGTGQPGFSADIAVQGDRIAAVGSFDVEAVRTIDARGATVIPGIIDPHSHADLILPLPPDKQLKLMACKLTQGITTTIIGNCGLGCAPLSGHRSREMLRAVNAWMTPQPVDWNWQTTGEYLDALGSNGVALNIATLAPHGPIRMSVMALSTGEPTKFQLKKMSAMVDRSMRDGAFGLSSGLIYPPGMYSSPAELRELAKVVADHDGIYTSHIRGSSETLIPAVEELLEIGRSTGVRVHHSHNEAVGRANWSKIDHVLMIEEQAEREGIRISFDMFPYTAAATMMIAIYPPWALEGGLDSLIERLRDAKIRRRIERDIRLKSPVWPPWTSDGWPHNLVSATGWNSIHIGYIDSRKNKRFENRSLSDLAEMTGKTPFNAISDLIIEEEGKVSMLIFDVSGERNDHKLLAKYASHRLCAFCTDAEDYGRGLPHPAAYGAFARILSKFVRIEKIMSFEEAIRRMTSWPARIFQLKDRGVIRPGAFADLAILDSNKIIDRSTYINPRRRATGIRIVVINGTVVLEKGYISPVLHGTILRKDP